MKIELNKEIKQALHLLEKTDRNVFITGKAGTGKSTLLEYFRKNTEKMIAVLAPTGVAAVNVKGETIHSFCRFRPGITPEKVKKIRSKKRAELYRELDMIIIDEISMVRADLLDCVDRFLRLNGNNKKLPFGGVRMVFIGDLYQLPPVVPHKEKAVFNSYYKSPYFFSAKVLESFDMSFMELTRVYRQKDNAFVELLNAIRNNTVTDEALNMINRRVVKKSCIEDLDGYVYLTPLNRVAARINQGRLSELKNKIYSYEGLLDGDFSSDQIPADRVLKIKKNAQVMLLNNDSLGRWVNGTVAKVKEIRKEEDGNDVIMVTLPNGSIEPVIPYTWELFQYEFNTQTQSIETKTIGSFTQYPLKLAWALTIHKSQGKTFDKMVIDINSGVFAPGQIYVALSRCRSLDGMVLACPVRKKHIFMDWNIVRFLTSYQYSLSEKKLPLPEKIRRIEEAVKEDRLLKIIYLKNSDEKTDRVIKPLSVGEMQYSGKPFLGMEAHCFKRNDTRVFRVDRILEMEDV